MKCKCTEIQEIIRMIIKSTVQEYVICEFLICLYFQVANYVKQLVNIIKHKQVYLTGGNKSNQNVEEN